MIIEFCHYDFSGEERETKAVIEQAIKSSPSAIFVLPYYLKTAKKIIPSHIQTGCIIDYPFGLSCVSSRVNEINRIKSSQPDIINLVCPTNVLCNRKYDKFREEIDLVLEELADTNIKIRYVLEYKICSLNLLHKIADILHQKSINVIYPSSGYLLDNVADNLLASFLINKKYPNIHIISNGPAWTNKQILSITKNKIYGFQTGNIHTLKNISEKLDK